MYSSPWLCGDTRTRKHTYETDIQWEYHMGLCVCSVRVYAYVCVSVLAGACVCMYLRIFHDVGLTLHSHLDEGDRECMLKKEVKESKLYISCHVHMSQIYMYMHVYIHACIYICICMYTWWYANIRIHSHTHTHVQMHMYICTGVRVYICINLWIINMQQFTAMFPQNEFPVRRHNCSRVLPVEIKWFVREPKYVTFLLYPILMTSGQWSYSVGPRWSKYIVALFQKNCRRSFLGFAKYPPKCRRTFLKKFFVGELFGVW